MIQFHNSKSHCTCTCSLRGGSDLICSLPWFWRFASEGPWLSECDHWICSLQTAASVWCTSATLTKRIFIICAIKWQSQICSFSRPSIFLNHLSSPGLWGGGGGWRSFHCDILKSVRQRSGLHNHFDSIFHNISHTSHMVIFSFHKRGTYSVCHRLFFLTSRPKVFKCKHCFMPLWIKSFCLIYGLTRRFFILQQKKKKSMTLD